MREADIGKTLRHHKFGRDSLDVLILHRQHHCCQHVAIGVEVGAHAIPADEVALMSAEEQRISRLEVSKRGGIPRRRRGIPAFHQNRLCLRIV